MMNSDTEEIKARLSVSDVLKDYIRLDKAGANYRALCPFHNEKTPSFMVSEDKGIWHCFGCGKGGDIFGFIMEIEGIEFREAIKLLAERAGVQLKIANPKLAAERNKTLEILELAVKFYETQLWKGNGKIKILNYLKGRGLKEETIKEFRLGYAPPGWRNLLTFLTGRGYKIEDIKKTGLLVDKNANQNSKSQIPNHKQIQNFNPAKAGQNSNCYDRFRDRIIFPIADVNSRVVGFSARVAPGGDESQAKYVNTPETEVYHKSRALYGIDKAKAVMRTKDNVLLVEGNMDVIAASQAGIKNVVAVSGTALTPDQVDIIKRYTKTIKMCFDMDNAGEAATKKSIALGFTKDMDVQVVELAGGKDAADIVQKDPRIFLAAAEKSKRAMDYLFDRSFSRYDRKSPEGKRKITGELIAMISAVENAIERSHWVKALAERLGIGESVLTDTLRKATLEEKLKYKSDETAFKNSFAEKIKIETLLNSLAGLMLVYPEVWKNIKKENEIIYSHSEIIKFIADEGEKIGFDFDQLVKSIDDQEKKAQIEQVYFGKRYRLGLNNVLEETELADPLREAKELVTEIEHEIKREKMQQISRDLESAEQKGDQDAVLFLKQQFNEILGQK
ncbi:MAG: DNA primase [Candidatus Moranbacteria bacterium]|nr:DNA primase [Candidatus Moranbacteria bacterium]